MQRAPALLPHVSAGSARAAQELLRRLPLGHVPPPSPARCGSPALAPLGAASRAPYSALQLSSPDATSSLPNPSPQVCSLPPVTTPALTRLSPINFSSISTWRFGFWFLPSSLPPLLRILLDCLLFAGGGGRRGASGTWRLVAAASQRAAWLDEYAVQRMASRCGAPGSRACGYNDIICLYGSN